MAVKNLDDFKALEPFFHIIRQGLDGLVDGEHFFELFAADGLAVHHDRETSVVVLEYAVHGRVVGTGRPYSNRFVSVINPVEALIQNGTLREMMPAGAVAPFVLGFDLAGTVTAVGRGVEPELVGAHVLGFSQWFMTGHGTQASLVNLPRENVAVAGGRYDPATGTTQFRANTMASPQDRSYSYDNNTVVTGAANVLANVVEDDFVTMYVEVTGSHSYSTTMDGSTTVPKFQAIMIDVTGSSE